MVSEQQREKARELITAIKSTLPDEYLTWIERVDDNCDQVCVRLTIHATVPMPHKDITSLDGDVARYGRIVGDEIRRYIGEEIRNILRNHYVY